MKNSRIKNTKRNIIYSVSDSIITLLFEFISRTVIVYYFGSEFLGLSSLFTSVLQVLNMAELGFSISITYNMYKPIADNDIVTVCSLLNYYKKIYKRIALFVFVSGVVVLPFLPFFIKDEIPSGINIYILYFIYLINTTSSYLFFSYKTALLVALQRVDITKKSYIISNIIQYLLQLISLIVLKNYYLFVSFIVLGTISKNCFSAYFSKKFFPEYVCDGEIKDKIKSDLWGRVKGALICNISSVTYTTFDSIIISSNIGLISVTKYNNYLVIYNGLMLFINLVRLAMQPSVGNSVATESSEKNFRDMLVFQFAFSFIATWCVTCMVGLFQPFMIIWMGEKLLLPLRDVLLICLLFYVSVVQNSFFLYLSGNGYWWEMRWPYIFSSVVNLGLNIVLGKLFGVTGVIFSTVLVSVVFCQIWQCHIVFEKYIKKQMWTYQLKQVGYFFVCLISCFIAMVINKYCAVNGIIGLIIKLLICTFVSISVQLIIYLKNKEFKDFLNLIRITIKER